MKIVVNNNITQNKQKYENKNVKQECMKFGVWTGAKIWKICSSIEQSEQRKIRKRAKNNNFTSFFQI